MTITPFSGIYAFLVWFQGITDAIFGPTLLDLTDIYQTKIKIISIVIIPKAVGSITGAFTAGLILDRLPDFRYFVLFSCTFLIGLCTAVLPHMVYLLGFFIVSIISSFFSSALHTGGNVLCLDTWKDASGPYLHSIHFSFAVCMHHCPNTILASHLKNLHKKRHLCYTQCSFP